MTVRGQHLLQASEPTSDDDDESDGDDNVFAGETCCGENEGMLSESDSLNVSENESDDSDCELALSLAKKRCRTNSGQSATSFAFNSRLALSPLL